jgi:signal peptidase II
MVSSGTVLRRAALAGTALALALALDSFTKWLIVNVVMVPPRTILIAPFFNLTLGFNTGVSFGMFRELFTDQPLLLAGIMALIAAGLLVWAVLSRNRIETLSLGLIAGGAAGNIVDRVRHGAVTDFLDFHIAVWHWPAFNLADVMIVMGAGLLITGSRWPVQSIALRRQVPRK